MRSGHSVNGGRGTTGADRFAAVGLAFVLAAMLLTPLPVLAAGGRAVEGVDRARLLAPAGARIEEYANAGYRLRRIDGEVHVEVDISPLHSTAAFTLPPQIGSDPVSRLARGLTLGAGTQYEAVSRILGWVARHIAYDLDRSQPQDAESVLARQSGYCTGVARLAVALLSAVGIEAREVAGYVADDGGFGPAAGYHRWIETLLPDRGWVFSDPLTSHHYVPATYLRLASEDLTPAQGIEGLLIERHNGLATVDLYLDGVPGITARRNSDRQLAAALRVEVAAGNEPGSGGVAVLSGASRRRTHVLIDGGTTFIGLEPGRYELRLLLAGGKVIERSLDLEDRARTTLSLPEPPRPAPQLLAPQLPAPRLSEPPRLSRP